MKKCRVVGLEHVTWKCNWNCTHCFFRRFTQLHTKWEAPLADLRNQIDAGKKRGCTSVVLCGYGEPTLYSKLEELIAYAVSIEMKPLIITNGTMGIAKYRHLYDIGLDHLQVSIHGMGTTLDKIAERKGAGRKQAQLVGMLHKEGLPFRVNTTLQALNQHQIYDIVEKAVRTGAFHISLLNFLPHYGANVKKVAVDPTKLVSQLEKSIAYMEGKTLFTIRYFPMCLLKPKYWKYVTNAKFVLFDPWEWEYGHGGKSIGEIWKHACVSADRTGIKGQPCASCMLKPHCGGWNGTYAQAFNLQGLRAIRSIPPGLQKAVGKRGGLFDLNPANKGRAAGI